MLVVFEQGFTNLEATKELLVKSDYDFEKVLE